jgi:hypothetical protein
VTSFVNIFAYILVLQFIVFPRRLVCGLVGYLLPVDVRRVFSNLANPRLRQ